MIDLPKCKACGEIMFHRDIEQNPTRPVSIEAWKALNRECNKCMLERQLNTERS